MLNYMLKIGQGTIPTAAAEKKNLPAPVSSLKFIAKFFVSEGMLPVQGHGSRTSPPVAV